MTMTAGRRRREENRPEKKKGRERILRADCLPRFLKIKKRRVPFENKPTEMKGATRQRKITVSQTANMVYLRWLVVLVVEGASKN